VRGVLSSFVAAPRERGGTHRRWVSADGPFSAACRIGDAHSQAQALIYMARPDEDGQGWWQGRGPPRVTGSLVNRLAVAPELPELKKYLNAL
jgi:hypothetical protein